MLPGRICPTSNCFTSSSESLTRGVPGSATYLPSAPRARSGFRWRSWETTITPSRVTPISSSSVFTPIESALANETSVFSGNSARPPRWASMSNGRIRWLGSVTFACSPCAAVPPMRAMHARTRKAAKQRRATTGVRRSTRTISPRAERGLAEQLFLRRGLRAPILRRCIDLATKLGRGVPGPAWIVKHATRERHHVDLAGSDDVFRLARFRDQTDGHGGHIRRLLDRPRKRDLITGRQRDFLLRRHAARGDVDPADAALLQFLREFDGLLGVPAAIDPV